MPVRRKVFRIEEMWLDVQRRGRATRHAGNRSEPASDFIAEQRALRERAEQKPAHPSPADCTTGAEGLRQLKDETDSIFRAIRETKQEIAALHLCGLSEAEGSGIRRELDAVVGAAEQATQQILTAAEDIDEAANTLSAILKGEHDQALAQDIREQVVRIFEACNFHDLAGQRIVKVLATLKFVDDRVARMMDIWGGIEAFREHAAAARNASGNDTPLLNGPKLAGQPGHATQADIDSLFAAT